MNSASVRMRSLQRANECRLQYAELRARIHASTRREGSELVAAVLEDPNQTFARMRIGPLLDAIPHVGPTTVTHWCNLIGVRSQDRRLGQLTERQRRELIAQLRGRGA